MPRALVAKHSQQHYVSFAEDAFADSPPASMLVPRTLFAYQHRKINLTQYRELTRTGSGPETPRRSASGSTC
jgi:hypothetical protein